MDIVDTRELPDPEHPEDAVTPLLKLLSDRVGARADAPVLLDELNGLWSQILECWGGPRCPKSHPEWEEQNYDTQRAAVSLRNAYGSLGGPQPSIGIGQLKEAQNALADVLQREEEAKKQEPGPLEILVEFH